MQRAELFSGQRHASLAHLACAPDRLATLEDRWNDGEPIQTFAFTRDQNGNITESLREDGSCWYYAYDGLQRLTGADWKDAEGESLYAFEYAYDKVGNRTGRTGRGTPYLIMRLTWAVSGATVSTCPDSLVWSCPACPTT